MLAECLMLQGTEHLQLWLSPFSVAVTKHVAQGTLPKAGFIGTQQLQKDTSPSGQEVRQLAAWRPEQEAENPHLPPKSQSRENELEAGKAVSFPSLLPETYFFQQGCPD